MYLTYHESVQYTTHGPEKAWRSCAWWRAIFVKVHWHAVLDGSRRNSISMELLTFSLPDGRRQTSLMLPEGRMRITGFDINLICQVIVVPITQKK
jgi:hypothetical protein